MRRFSSSPDDRRRDQYRDHHGSSRPNRRYDRSDRHEPYQRYNARYDADYSPQRPPDRSRGRNRNGDRRNVDRRNADRNRRPEGEPMLGRLIRVEYDRGFGFIRYVSPACFVGGEGVTLSARVKILPLISRTGHREVK